MGDTRDRDLTDEQSTFDGDVYLGCDKSGFTKRKKIKASTIVSDEASTRETKDNAIIAGAGLQANGSYSADAGSAFLKTATSLYNALSKLDDVISFIRSGNGTVAELVGSSGVGSSSSESINASISSSITKIYLSLVLGMSNTIADITNSIVSGYGNTISGAGKHYQYIFGADNEVTGSGSFNTAFGSSHIIDDEYAFMTGDSNDTNGKSNVSFLSIDGQSAVNDNTLHTVNIYNYGYKIYSGSTSTSTGGFILTINSSIGIVSSTSSFSLISTNNMTLINGLEITLLFTVSATVVNGTASNQINLQGAADFNATANDTLVLKYISGKWYEISRSIN